jgi:gamma-glutamyltranspeptidase/glutathione hydrolase
MAEFAERFLAKVGKAKEHGAGAGEVGVLHAFAEAMRRSFVLRFAYGGDTDKPAARLGQLFPNKIRRKLQRSFRANGVTPTDSIAIGGSTVARQRGNTSHLSIVDAKGMALFGAGIVTPNGGVWLNNELDDFSFTLKDSNAFGLAGNAAGLFRAGARPPSSMTPTILLEKGKPRLLIGAPGGTRIPTAVFQAAWWYLVAGLPLQQAVAKMRVHHQGFPDQIWLEKGAAADGVSKGLEGIGHRVKKVRPWCNIQAVGITSAPSRKLEAVSDNRYEGGAMAL